VRTNQRGKATNLFITGPRHGRNQIIPPRGLSRRLRRWDIHIIFIQQNVDKYVQFSRVPARDIGSSVSELQRLHNGRLGLNYLHSRAHYVMVKTC
jgi:hypothetical protein